MYVPPARFRLLLPVAESLQPEVKHPLRLPFLSRDEPDDVLVQALLYDFSVHVRGEAELVFLLGHLADKVVITFHLPLTIDH